MKHITISTFLLLLLFLQAGSLSAQEVSDSSRVVIDTLPPLATGYDWISYRGKADLVDTGGTRTCNFFMVNRKDSILYLNVQAYSVEVMRIVFTPDSVTYVNKLTYQYYKGGYAQLRLLTGLPISFQMIQALFNGDTDKLPQRQKLVFEYRDFERVDSTSSFFREIHFKDLDHLFEIHARLKSLKFNVPGPTSIRIPERFQELNFLPKQ